MDVVRTWLSDGEHTNSDLRGRWKWVVPVLAMRCRTTILLILLPWFLVTCNRGGSDGSGEGNSPAQISETAEQEPVQPPDPEEQQKEALRVELGPALTELAVRAAAEDRFRIFLEIQGRIPLTSWRREVLLELYGERGYQTIFVAQGGRSEGFAEPLLAELRAAYHHALDSRTYHLDRLDALDEVVDALVLPDPPQWRLDESAFESLFALGVRDGEELAARLVDAGDPGHVPELRTSVQSYADSVASHINQAIELELLLADAFLSYARDMKLGNTNRLSEGELLELGGSSQVVADRLREVFRTIASFDRTAFSAYLEDLIPKHPQYGLLMESLAHYRQIVETGGWLRVPPRDISPGRTHARIRQLKERLTTEGFYEGVIDNTWDETLTSAVIQYQETHQMPVTGEVHNIFWSSINVPAQRRLAQIELTLQRWRESRIGDDPYYVFVNVPDFHAEVWRDGERLRRFRVVTGNRVQECDPETGGLRYANATPLISAEIEYLVFNPYWNVPDRIRREELDLELIENPAWLQENGYEVVVTGGSPRIRQLPGETNALGAVKFIFPNDHNIYMHDTPHRRYFEFPIRAYSHGCIRVHEPMGFAELLLREDGSWDEERINRIREAGVERTVRLSTPVPIHIEYYVVRIDDNGRANFLSDVYRYDRERLGDLPPEAEECEAVEVVDEGMVTWAEDGSASLPDGTVVFVDGTVEMSEQRMLELGLTPVGEEGAVVAPIGGKNDDSPTDESDTDESDTDEPSPGDIGP